MTIKELLIYLNVISLLHISNVTSSEDFEMDSKYYLLNRLREINPSLQWDETGLLERLSTTFATCANAHLKGIHPVNEPYQDGSSIIALVDHTKGSMTDYLSLQMYVRNIIFEWMTSNSYDLEFKAARYVGCKTQTGCSGVVVISCLFTPGISYDTEIKDPGTRRALTDFQQEKAENITGKYWDKTHFLENLASLEVSCAMVNGNSQTWDFSQTKAIASDWGITDLRGNIGSTVNTGNTETALITIIREFGNTPRGLDSFGCSMIPDCQIEGNLRLVLTCLYAAI